MMFPRNLLLVTVYVFTLFAGIQVTISQRATLHDGYMNGGSYNDPHTIFHNGHAHNPYSSGADPSRHHPIVGYPGYLVYQNVPYNSQNPSPGGSLGPADDPQWQTFGDSELDALGDPQMGAFGDSELDALGDPQRGTFADSELDALGDPQRDTAGDPACDPGDPGWDPEGDPNDPDDPGLSVTDMISRMAQGVMSLGQNPAIGTLANVLRNSNPVANTPNFGASYFDPGITDFSALPDNLVQQLPNTFDSGITDFSALPNSLVQQLSNINTGTSGLQTNLADIIPQTSQELTGALDIGEFASDENNVLSSADVLSIQQGGANPSTITDSVSDVAEFDANQGNILPQLFASDDNPTTYSSNFVPAQQSDIATSLNQLASSNSEPEITSLAATQENTITKLLENETSDSTNFITAQQDHTTLPELLFIPFVNDNDAPETSYFVATEGNTLPHLLDINNQAQDLESDSLQFTSFGNNDEGYTTQLGDGFTVRYPVSDIAEYSDNQSAEYRDNQSFNRLSFINPLITNILSNNKNFGLSQSSNTYTNSIFNSRKINTRVPLQILFRSNVSRGGVQVSNNLGKNSNYIRSHIPGRSIHNAIRDSAEIFNITQRAPNFNINPFLVLTPKNLTRSSLSETNMETYITAEEIEALYEEAVSADTPVKVLFLPDFELSEKQIQNIVNKIALEIYKEEGNNCQELVLIPLDLFNNSVAPSEISATAVENSECENTWSSPLYSDSGEIHYQQEPSETTFSSSSSDTETTTGFTDSTSSTSQTCQNLTTERDLCNPILSIDTPPYPEMTTPCPTSLLDDLSCFNFSSSGASAVNELSIRSDQNQEPAKEEQNCSTQLKNKTEHPTEIFIPCFISIGHDSNALEKKICEIQQNGYITKLLPQHYMFKINDQDIQSNPGGTISTYSNHSLPCSPCPGEDILHSTYNLEIKDSESSNIQDQTCTPTTIEPVNYVALSDSSKMNNPQGIWDSVNFEEEEKSVSDEEKSSYLEITAYPNQNNSASSSTTQDCAAGKMSDDKQSSTNKMITYPITVDSEVKPILRPCTSEETEWNSGTDNITDKYEVTNKQISIDQSGTMNSKGDETEISNEYCHNQKPTASENLIDTDQFKYSGTSIRELDLIKKNAKDNHSIIVGKGHILHPKTGITILDAIKKNAKINDFTDNVEERNTLEEKIKYTCSENIDSTLPQTPQGNEVNPSWGSENIDSSSSSDDKCKCNIESGYNDQVYSSDDTHSPVYNIDTPSENHVNLTENQDQAKCIPDTKQEVPKCPSSKIFIVKIDNLKPKNGSCPCSSFNSLVDTVCSNGVIKNSQSNDGNSKDHSCLCKLLSMHQQKIGPSEDWNLNKTCANSASPPTSQEIPGYDMIPTNEDQKADDIIHPLEITKTSEVWDNVNKTNTNCSTIEKQTCDKNIDTTIEIDSSTNSSVNNECPCNLENVIEQQRNVSQKSEGYAQKNCTNLGPSSPVCQKLEISKVCPPSDKQSIQMPTLKPIIQTFPAAHKMPVPNICPPAETPNYKPTVQNPPTPQPIPNICPPCYEHPKKAGIPIIMPTAQTVPTPPKIPDICPQSHEHSNKTFMPAIQTIPKHKKIPEPEICPSADEHTKKTEIPIFKPTVQTIPTQHICLPEDCPPFHLSNKTIGLSIDKPKTQDLPIPQKLPEEPNICSTTNEPVNTEKIITKSITQSQDWEINTVESQTEVVDSPSCEKNLNNEIDFADELKASLNESCLCKLRAVLDKHRISSGKNSQKVDEIIQKPYGITTFPSAQNDPVLTNRIPTDVEVRMNEVNPPSVSQTKDWNTTNNYNSQVNNGSCIGDMKPTTEMDCKECQERRKELLAKILKEVFINNLDLLCEEKKP